MGVAGCVNARSGDSLLAATNCLYCQYIMRTSISELDQIVEADEPSASVVPSPCAPHILNSWSFAARAPQTRVREFSRIREDSRLRSRSLLSRRRYFWP